MQQRGSSGASMDGEDGDQSNAPPSRGRPTSKLKVLGRSHAMREEQSPPRAPSAGGDQTSPVIQLSSSPGKPMVVLSPSPFADEEGGEEGVTQGPGSGGGSPTSTLVATPNSRCSPLCATMEGNGACERLHPAEPDLPPSPKYLNGRNGVPSDKTHNKSSQVNLRGKKYCDCQNQNCIKCIKDKSINNNHSNVNNNVVGSPNMLFVSKTRGKLKQQSSSQTSFESSSANSPCLSRDSSSELYTDTTGIDLEQFIPETLNRNPKDRALMLRIEEELVNLAKDIGKTHFKFPPMTSYHRMLVHRCAAYFGMDHNIEPSGKSVVVNKTKNTRIPEVAFKEHIKSDIIFSDEPPRRSILKRDSNSIEDYCFKSPDRGYNMENKRSKSFEEREEEYEKARRRIFNREMHDGSSEDFGWSDIQWSSTDSDYISKYRLQPPEFQSRQLRKLLKVQSEETAESMRPCVAKSYSFGGYGGSVSILTRGDSVMSTHSAGPRLLTKQDSGASSVSWRLSPSSSGYKSQSQMSESVTPSPTSTPHPPGDTNSGDGHEHHRGGNSLLWAVTDMHSVPKGSIIINPDTGKPYKNEDGTIYHYDPNRPPPGLLSPPPPRPPAQSVPPISPHESPQKEKMITSSPKHERRPISKSSPIKSKCNLTNSATSPSLPFSPPLSTSSSVGMPTTRSYPYLQVVSSCENIANLPQQQHFSGYASAPAEGNVPVYQQPYILYTAPYSVPVPQQYDGRMDQANLPELSTTYYVPETTGQPTPQTITYQTQPTGPFWNQQPISFYPNSPQPTNSTPPQRFSVPMQQGQTTFMPSSFPINYVAQAPAPPSQNPEMVPVYTNQPAQMVYPNQPNGAVIYQNQQPLIYAHNTALYSTAYPSQSVPPYPQSTPTPNSCSPSVSNNPFVGNLPNNGYMQLTQSMHQMNLGSVQASTPRSFMPMNSKCPQQFGLKQPFIPNKPPSKFSGPQPRPFFMGSSQSSTGTNSPAATVVAAGYCPMGAGAPGPYRTPPPGTPPTPQFVFHQPGFGVAPRLFRQMSGERGPTPGTARSSRSPTPASDIPHFDRQRFPIPPNLYQGMPYIVQSDSRLVGRGQPNVYRQTPPTALNRQPNTINQGSENRSHYNNNNSKGRKPKGNKVSGLPPSGK